MLQFLSPVRMRSYAQRDVNFQVYLISKV